ncbi:MAG: hypothetical protein ABJB95_04055, partial [Gemmatimonadales bacterium]
MIRNFRFPSRQAALIAICSMVTAACGSKPDTSSADTASTSGTPTNSASASSTSAPPSVRGTVASISATSLVIKTDTGDVTVRLTQPFQVYAREPAKLADVKDNSFLGVTTVKQPDGTERATEIHIFPEELRGMGEGSRMMAQ